MDFYSLSDVRAFAIKIFSNNSTEEYINKLICFLLILSVLSQGMNMVQ